MQVKNCKNDLHITSTFQYQTLHVSLSNPKSSWENQNKKSSSDINFASLITGDRCRRVRWSYSCTSRWTNLPRSRLLRLFRFVFTVAAGPRSRITSILSCRHWNDLILSLVQSRRVRQRTAVFLQVYSSWRIWQGSGPSSSELRVSVRGSWHGRRGIHQESTQLFGAYQHRWPVAKVSVWYQTLFPRVTWKQTSN